MINHVPVMMEEAIKNLNVDNEGVYIDATLGGGGYSKLLYNLVQKSNFKTILISFDLDYEAIENYKEFFKITNWENVNEKIIFTEIDGMKIILVNDNFANISEVMTELYKKGIVDEKYKVHGIVADLGLNSSQLDSKKGFSFQNLQQDLDMRLDKNSGVKASDLLIVGNAKQLSEMFTKYGDLKNSWKLAQNIKKFITKPTVTVNDLINIINKTFGKNSAVKNDVHAKVFQALRIAVNNEYYNLEQLLLKGTEVLEQGGRIIIVSFHSGEDRIVKHYINKNKDLLVALYEGKIQIPSEDETEKNPRARSAKLRGFIKL